MSNSHDPQVTPPASEPTGPTRTQIREVFERAVLDYDYRKLLIEDVDRALEGYTLTEGQRLLIKGLDMNDLEKLNAENLNEYFSVDSQIYLPDDMLHESDGNAQMSGRLVYSIDDLVDPE